MNAQDCITIYEWPDGWHWKNCKRGTSSAETFATAQLAEAAAILIAGCVGLTYVRPQTAHEQFIAEYEAALAVGHRYQATGDVGVFFHATHR